MMGVHVHVGHAYAVTRAHRGDSHGRVIVNAESRGPREMGMVQPAGRREGMPHLSLHYCFGCHRGAACDQSQRPGACRGYRIVALHEAMFARQGLQFRRYRPRRPASPPRRRRRGHARPAIPHGWQAVGQAGSRWPRRAARTCASTQRLAPPGSAAMGVRRRNHTRLPGMRHRKPRPLGRPRGDLLLLRVRVPGQPAHRPARPARSVAQSAFPASPPARSGDVAGLS